MLITDYDRMTQNIDGEGSPFALSQQRTAKFLSRGMTLVETSPGFEISDPKHKPSFLHEAPPCAGALSLFNMGDMRRYYVKCPECNDYFMPPPAETGLDFIHDRDLFGATETIITRPVRYVCTKNGCLIDVKHKKQMNQTGIWLKQGMTIDAGKITGEPVKSRIASFWFPGVFAAYSDPTAMVEKYLKSYREYDITGSEENLKTVINVGFGAAYLRRNLAEIESSSAYSDRSEALNRYFVPDDARLLLASVDIQNGKTGRFVVQVHAIGKNMEQWVVDRFDIAFTEREGKKCRVEPGVYSEDWELLTHKVINSSYKTSDGRKMLVHAVSIDTGGNGNTTDYCYQYYKRLRRLKLSRKVMLIKGGSNDSKSPIIPSYGKDRDGRKMLDVPLNILNTNSFKDKVSAMLNRTVTGGLYLHFPDWLPESFYDELLAEKRDVNGKWGKIKDGSNNESLDLSVYILALCWKLGLNDAHFNWEKPPKWALPIANGNVRVMDADEARTERQAVKKQTKKPAIKKGLTHTQRLIAARQAKRRG